MRFDVHYGIDGTAFYRPRPDEPSEAQKVAWTEQFNRAFERRMRNLQRRLGARRFKRYMAARVPSDSRGYLVRNAVTA